KPLSSFRVLEFEPLQSIAPKKKTREKKKRTLPTS
ncbi:hypothetical protein Gotur_018316, partial [Gossypium turneri]